MTSEVQRTYYGWQHGELSEKEVSQGAASLSQFTDHGSISFGRFALESLSWEKRSVFTHNERQEELEKFKSPGLVAKKRAYFEEYYKRIRDLKAKQNQQTELSLEYGADDSISSQAGDDDEPTLLSTELNLMPENNNQGLLEDLSVEVSFEPDYNKTYDHEYVGPGCAEDTTETEAIELHACSDNSVQVKIYNPESLVNSLSTQNSEEIKLNDDSHAVKVTHEDDTKLKMEPDLTSMLCLSKPTISDAIQRYLDDAIPAAMSKECGTSAACISKRVDKSVSERTKSSLGSKYLQQKSIDKAEMVIPTAKQASCKTRNIDKCSVVASQSPPALVKSKVASPKTVSVSRERKGAMIDTSGPISRFSKVPVRSPSGIKGNLRLQASDKKYDGNCRLQLVYMKLESLVIAGQPQVGEFVPRPCAHRPPHSGSWSYPKNSKLISASQLFGNTKSDSVKKKVATSEKHGLSPSGVRKSSISGKMSRLENPRWR